MRRFRNSVLALSAAVLAAAGIALAGSPRTQAAEAASDAACQTPGVWLDPATRGPLAFEDLTARLAGRKVVLLGESHTDMEHHRWQLHTLAGLKAPVDRFFDDVLVMAEDSDLKNNRLALLGELRDLFLDVADISRLSMA